MKTGNTRKGNIMFCKTVTPQWSPVMKTGNTCAVCEPASSTVVPQWSPVMKTGNTSARVCPEWTAPRSLNGARS